MLRMTPLGDPDRESRDIRMLMTDLVQSTETLSALVVALSIRSGRVDGGTELARRVAPVMAALGVDLEDVPPRAADQLAGMGAGMLAQAGNLASHPDAPKAWNVVDDSVLDGLGAASAGFAVQIRDVVAPRLADLEQRLQGTPVILDVGSGVAALSIALAATFATAHVVGIDVWEPALARARVNVAASGLGERIDIRRQDVCDLAVDREFDLIWFAGPFIPTDLQLRALQRCAAALKQGGWLVYGTFAGRDPLSDALADLRALRSGGPVVDDEAIGSLLRSAGLEQITPVAVQVGLPSRIVAGRRC
jgi:SAM-dependent methyltransferase